MTETSDSEPVWLDIVFDRLGSSSTNVREAAVANTLLPALKTGLFHVMNLL